MPAASLKRGDAGAGVAWVKGALASLDGGAAESGPAFFDAELEERVRKLQIAYGIKADGIVGPETLFALSALDEAGRASRARCSRPHVRLNMRTAGTAAIEPRAAPQRNAADRMPQRIRFQGKPCR